MRPAVSSGDLRSVGLAGRVAGGAEEAMIMVQVSQMIIRIACVDGTTQ